MLKKLAAGFIGASLVLAAAPAFAGEWKLNKRACPDLVEDHFDRIEDRRDARFDFGRRDRREDRYDRRENRRDEAFTICPTSAFYYVPDRREQRRYARFDGRHDNGRGHAYGRAKWEPKLPVKWDQRNGRYYMRVDGRTIYVSNYGSKGNTNYASRRR